MRWTTARIAICCFALSVATACASVVAQQNSNLAGNSNYQADVPSANETEPPVPLEEESSDQLVVNFEPVEVIGSGYTNAEAVRLRESPEAGVAGSNVVEIPNGAYLEILGTTRDYLHVRVSAGTVLIDDENYNESAREGWVAWGEVMPGAMALVLDAETGAVVSRLPFTNFNPGTSVAFSPDNSRAVFYGEDQAYEVNTEDYTLTRSFKAQLVKTPFNAVSFFYGSTGNTLYAALGPSNYTYPAVEALLNIVRLDNVSGPAPQPEISERAVGFAISPDGSKGFLLHPVNDEAEGMLVDVLDLQGMRVSNTFTLRGEKLPATASEVVTNRDGSELYFSLFPSCEVISVIDTSTGHVLREIPAGDVYERAQYLTQKELVGSSLFFRIWGEDDTQSRGVWLDEAGKQSEIPRGIDHLVEANGVRLGVNDAGTRLFKLDAENRVSQKYRIERPDISRDPNNASDLIVHGFFASPDGKRLIVILGVEHGC